MSDNPSKNRKQSDEIDLGQLFQLIGSGFNQLFRGLLHIYLFLKRNIFILWTGKKFF